MRFSKTLERQQIEFANVFMGEKIGQQVVALVVPRAAWGLGTGAGYDSEIRIRRIAGEIFVWIDVSVCGMIDCDELHRVEVYHFLHGFPETEAKNASCEARLEG